MKIEIVRASVFQGNGAATVYLYTTLPSGIWPFEGCAHVTLNTAKGAAIDWIEKNLPGVPIEVIGE